ncbi:VOC family protein [Enterococcus sp. 669A]|uniref:VOC family protein n=1 Tax=Candidatus Enterococcus moelleringii TaxID=2815325 RepID=A0ABS3L954_9ENTE|nr:VOC family protein [Enterococcus sp. 669A]MBO1304969.1 VOC family protein [Enterococcus sp. 669A]
MIAHHVCIQTNTYQESLAFYQKLGFELVQESPNFHGRSYNTWLALSNFYIELQTGKDRLETHDPQVSEGIAHLCLWVEDLPAFLSEKKFPDELYVKKEKIYTVENGQLTKLRAPEGTIIEIRNNPGI